MWTTDWLCSRAAIATPKLFIVAGMIHDQATRRAANPAWWIGLLVSSAVEGASLMVAGPALGTPVAQTIAAFAGVFGEMY